MKQIFINVKEQNQEERKDIINALKNGGVKIKWDYWCGYIVAEVDENDKL
jgi:hypothetical protein